MLENCDEKRFKAHLHVSKKRGNYSYGFVPLEL